MQRGLSFYLPRRLKYYFGCYTYYHYELNGSVSCPEYLYPYVWLCKPSFFANHICLCKLNFINFVKTVILNKLAREKFPCEILSEKNLH